MRLKSAFALFLPFFALLAGSASGEVARATPSSPEYVDVDVALTEPADIDAWYGLMSKLKLEFDQVCGDTFCEGDYSNIEALRFRCSVHARTGRIGQCVWVFAASNEEVAARTGKIEVDAKSWQCQLPLARGTTLKEFLRTLAPASVNALETPLPRTSSTLYDGLLDCL